MIDNINKYIVKAYLVSKDYVYFNEAYKENDIKVVILKDNDIYYITVFSRKYRVNLSFNDADINKLINNYYRIEKINELFND